jgi:hypothetical protein
MVKRECSTYYRKCKATPLLQPCPPLFLNRQFARGIVPRSSQSDLMA